MVKAMNRNLDLLSGVKGEAVVDSLYGLLKEYHCEDSAWSDLTVTREEKFTAGLSVIQAICQEYYRLVFFASNRNSLY